jgi:hypothetical protein
MSEPDTWPPVEWLVEPAADITAEEYSARYAVTVVIQEGDVVWRFSSPPDSWKYLAGRAGFALVRDGKIVHSFTRILS